VPVPRWRPVHGQIVPRGDCQSIVRSSLLEGQHVTRDCLEHAGDGQADRRAHCVAEFTVRFLDERAEDAIELFLVCDFQQCDGLLHFLMLVEESVLGFSIRWLRPGVFEFQLGRVLGQWVRERAHVRSLATVQHLSEPCFSTIHSSDRSGAMHVPFTKTRKCASISTSACEARFGLPAGLAAFGEDNFAVASHGRTDPWMRRARSIWGGMHLHAIALTD
jgi:hypothetical protein